MAKSKYKTHVEPYLHLIPSWRKKGMTELQVAKKLRISKATLEEYKHKFPDFLDAIKKGKDELVKELESALYKRARGFEYEEVHTEIEKTDKGEKKKVKKIMRYVAPDVGALCFSLKNLEGETWKEKVENNSGDKPIEIVIKNKGGD